MRKLLSLACLLNILTIACGQHHETSEQYRLPEDPLVQQKLTRWQDLKFGLFMHWGTYSQWGIVESWTLCPEDEDWTQRKGPHADDYFAYKKAYENLQTTFNPTKFNPEKWVKAAKEAGMKYMVFTTKHHDGFAMFDTRQSDYKITSAKTPFSTHPRSNVTKEIFDAFRKENFMIGAYFSKPDWHTEYYWWPYFPPKTRNVNYDPAKHPGRWQKFKDFTYNQIEELTTGYGKVDILWLDGGWVRPLASVDTTVDWQCTITHDQDIDMARIAGMARNNQPGLIIVDRTVPGEFENYTTPEQNVPAQAIAHPWETCMTMGNSWSYVPNDKYKSTHQLIELLVKIVSRGGNFLLNIGPGPDGDWDPTAYRRLEEMGKWMQVNGEGIYASRAIAPYSSNNIYFTKAANKNTMYAFYLSADTAVTLPAQVDIPLQQVQKIKKVSLLGSRQPVKWSYKNGIVQVSVPAALQQNNGLQHAATFKIDY